MYSTQRAPWKIWTIATLVLGGLLLSTSAEASDRDRSERIHHQLALLAFAAVVTGDAYLAYSLERRDHRMEHRGTAHWRPAHRRHHHHFAGSSRSHHRVHSHSPPHPARKHRHYARRHH